MGYGGYSLEAHTALTAPRAALPVQAYFGQRECHPLMRPHGIKVRESRDSADHPASLAIVLALDVTQSMGDIPVQLAQRELPGFMKQLRAHGVTDPQVLFLAVGDAYSDRAPLQVGQFESTGELMDQWLTWTWLESGGGRHGHESYDLALYFAARHLDLDCHRIRGKRGYLFMTGDERPYPTLSAHAVKSVLGDALDEDLPLRVVVDEASRALEPFFLIPDLTRRAFCERAWRDVLGDRVVALESPADACPVMAGIVALGERVIPDLDALARHLASDGVPRDRVGAVVRALTPWAASIDADRAAAPALERDVELPNHLLGQDASASGHRRIAL